MRRAATCQSASDHRKHRVAPLDFVDISTTTSFPTLRIRREPAVIHPHINTLQTIGTDLCVVFSCSTLSLPTSSLRVTAYPESDASACYIYDLNLFLMPPQPTASLLPPLPRVSPHWRCHADDYDYLVRRALRRMCTQPTLHDHFFPQASEIIPGLFVADLYTATSSAVLSHLGITHVVSLIHAHGVTFPRPIAHLSVSVEDTEDADLLGHLDDVVRWIRVALAPTGEDGAPPGHVLIHCVWGMSRSATVAAAFLIAARGMTLATALRTLRAQRPVARPNPGFMRQLQAFERATRLREAHARRASSASRPISTDSDTGLGQHWEDLGALAARAG